MLHPGPCLYLDSRWYDPMTELDTARLVAEILTIIGLVGSGVLVLMIRISRVLRAVQDVQEAIGDEQRPKAGTIRAHLQHQDTCTDDVKKALALYQTVEEKKSTAVVERLARIEGKLSLAPIEEEK